MAYSKSKDRFYLGTLVLRENTAASIMHELTLEHRGTGERKTVPVIYVTRTRVGIRWVLAGCYELSLEHNYLLRAPLWRAVNIEEVRNEVRRAMGLKFGA